MYLFHYHFSHYNNNTALAQKWMQIELKGKMVCTVASLSLNENAEQKTDATGSSCRSCCWLYW